MGGTGEDQERQSGEKNIIIQICCLGRHDRAPIRSRGRKEWWWAMNISLSVARLSDFHCAPGYGLVVFHAGDYSKTPQGEAGWGTKDIPEGGTHLRRCEGKRFAVICLFLFTGGCSPRAGADLGAAFTCFPSSAGSRTRGYCRIPPPRRQRDMSSRSRQNRVAAWQGLSCQYW